MGRVNWVRVMVGGLLAGLIVNCSEFVLNTFVIADDMEAAMKAMNLPAMDSSEIPAFVGLGFLLEVRLSPESYWSRTGFVPQHLLTFRQPLLRLSA